MTATLPVHCEPVVASAMIGSSFSTCPLTHRGSAHSRPRRSRSNHRSLLRQLHQQPRRRDRLGAAHRQRPLARLHSAPPRAVADGDERLDAPPDIDAAVTG